MKEYTDITVLLDRSGSMDTIRKAMEEAFNGFIHEHKKNKSTRITLIQFDGTNPQQVVYQNVPVAEAGKLKLVPRGSTPLMDALCTAIDNTGERLADMDEEDRPDQVLFLIITDGEENASHKYRRSDVKDRISKQSNAFKWQFIYMGANQDAFREAESYGISHKHAINFLADATHTHSAWRGATINTVNYASATGGARSSAAMPMAAALDFSDEQLKEAVDNSTTGGTK